MVQRIDNTVVYSIKWVPTFNNDFHIPPPGSPFTSLVPACVLDGGGGAGGEVEHADGGLADGADQAPAQPREKAGHAVIGHAVVRLRHHAEEDDFKDGLGVGSS